MLTALILDSAGGASAWDDARAIPIALHENESLVGIELSALEVLVNRPVRRTARNPVIGNCRNVVFPEWTNPIDDFRKYPSLRG